MRRSLTGHRKPRADLATVLDLLCGLVFDLARRRYSRASSDAAFVIFSNVPCAMNSSRPIVIVRTRSGSSSVRPLRRSSHAGKDQLGDGLDALGRQIVIKRNAQQAIVERIGDRQWAPDQRPVDLHSMDGEEVSFSH